MRRISTFLVLLLTALLLSVSALAQDVITTAIGGGPNNMPALDADLNTPFGTAVDAAGANFYVAASNQNRVFKVNISTGTLTVVAGSGAQGYSGDGIAGGAANANLFGPYGVAVDGSGNVYIADQGNQVVRKVSTAGTITTIAGTGGQAGFFGDGGLGTKAKLFNPRGVAVDGSGNLYIADYNNCRVRKLILSTNIISTYAGTGSCNYTGDGGAATLATLNAPGGVAVDTAGDLFIADSSNVVIREVVKSTGKISTVAGNHTAGFMGDSGKATLAEINQTFALAVNGAGTVVTIADFFNHRIRQFTVGGNINTVAGTGTPGFTGDGSAATSADINAPNGISATTGGTFFIGDSNNERVRKFTVGGVINTVAGNGSTNTETPINPIDPHGAVLNSPYSVVADSTGNVYVAERAANVIRELVHSTGKLNNFAGTGTAGFLGDGLSATSAEVNQPFGVAKDGAGNVYIADTNNCVIRKVNTAGIITTFAGTPNRCGFLGEGGPATSAEFFFPRGVAVDSSNNVYIADTDNGVIREVVAGTISTIAGIPGHNGYSGDGGPATSALLSSPTSIAIDSANDVFIADQNNHRIREISAQTGNISTVAGNGSGNFTGDGIANQNALSSPQGVIVDRNNNLFIADTNNERVRWVSPSGVMTTIAGNGTFGYNGDGGPATSAELAFPTGVGLDPSANILVADQNNFRIRSITTFPALNSTASYLTFGLTNVGSTSNPQVITLSALGAVNITDIALGTSNFTEADNCPASLTAGSVCTMYVYFAPTAAGTLKDTITINTNGLFNPVVPINLAGIGSAISLTGAPVSFGNQLVHTTSATKNVVIKNNGTTAITMGTIALNETTDFKIATNNCPASGSTLGGGLTCTLGLTFTPASTGVKKGAVIVNDNDPTSPQIIGLSGTGFSNVVLSPNPVSFALTAVGSTSGSVTVKLTNNTAVNITLGTPAVTFTGPFALASGTTCTNGLLVAGPGGTCNINVSFKPTALGFVKGLLSVADSDVTSPQTVVLKGTGTGIKFTPFSVNFGTVNRGTQIGSPVSITNVGPTPVTFTGAEIAGTNSADFTASSLPNVGCQNGTPLPLQPGAVCTITVFFDPSKVGVEKATYMVFDNSPGSPQKLSMTGTGQ
jgi:hypothetical protein